MDRQNSHPSSYWTACASRPKNDVLATNCDKGRDTNSGGTRLPGRNQ